MDGAAGMALDHQRPDPVPAEEHRGGHPDQAAAGDQDRYLVVDHAAPPVCVKRICPAQDIA
jgi:hypothetical protein